MIDRRLFLQRLASLSAAGAVPAPIAKALAQPANRRTGTLKDVEHVVILMQENRAFDHYFGTLPGVRGFADPRAMQLRSGASVFHQPRADGSPVLPFRMDGAKTSGQLLKSLDHSWKGAGEQSSAKWAEYDRWIDVKGEMTMGYFTRQDVPFYHALADAFTVCDAYYCSLHGPTNPNRMYLFTGTSGMAVGDMRPHAVHNEDDGNWTGDASRDKPDWAGAARWTTYAERLQKAGVDWKVYQEFDNFGCNSLAYFKQFRGLDPSSELYRRGRAMVPGSTPENAPQTTGQHLVDAIRADVEADRLPQVSWVVTPTKFCEHPEAPPAFGEDMLSRVLDALVSNPEVWSKTALIINYDENDGFFDHMPGPIPAIERGRGLSTVDTRGEVYEGQSVGLGMRVPLLVVSPWSRGGWVNSQVHDHTSVIRFLEKRFGVMEPNITPWRRAVAGDLTSLFDFADPDTSALHALPATDDYLARIMAAAKMPAPVVPAQQSLPKQETGRRPTRALPYRLALTSRRSARGLEITFANTGGAGAVFQVYAPKTTDAGPWTYTVEAGKQVSDVLPGLPGDAPYDLVVHGPNGWLRELSGDADEAAPEIVLDESDPDTLKLTVANPSSRAARLTLSAPTYGEIGTRKIDLEAGKSATLAIPVKASANWYDLVVTQDDARFVRRFAGHAETGRPSLSDPALEMGGAAA